MEKLELTDYNKVQNLIMSGRKIEAIKELREQTGLSLYDAREYVEKIEKENYNCFYYNLELLKDKITEKCQRRIFQMDYAHYMKKKEKEAKVSRIS